MARLRVEGSREDSFFSAALACKGYGMVTSTSSSVESSPRSSSESSALDVGGHARFFFVAAVFAVLA